MVLRLRVDCTHEYELYIHRTIVRVRYVGCVGYVGNFANRKQYVGYVGYVGHSTNRKHQQVAGSDLPEGGWGVGSLCARPTCCHPTFQHVSPDGGLINIMPFPQKLPIYQQYKYTHGSDLSATKPISTSTGSMVLNQFPGGWASP